MGNHPGRIRVRMAVCRAAGNGAFAVHRAGCWRAGRGPGGPNAEGAEFSTTQSFKFDVPPQLGDVNADGKINAGDVAEMVNYLLGKPSSKFMIEVANINGDDVVDLADVIMIVNLIMVTE